MLQPIPARALALATLLLALAGAPRLGAMGSPPLITDDTGTAPAGHFEFNLGCNTERRPGSRLSEVPAFDVNYGLGEGVHFNLALPWLRLGEDGAAAHQGLGNSTLGVTWRFVDGGEKGLSVSVFPKVEFINTGSGSADHGLVARGTHGSLPVQFQHRVGPLTLVGQLGREFAAGSDGWSYGVSAGRQVSDKVEIGAELAGGASGGLHHSSLAANLGLTVELGERCSLVFSVGKELHNHDEPRASLLAHAGLQWRR